MYRRGLALMALLAGSVGCGGRGDVSGEVRFKGQPLPAGRITFLCEEGDKPVLTSDVRDGKYAVQGAPIGAAKIAVVTYETKTTPVPNMPKDAALSPNGAAAAPAGKYVPIPPRYADPEKSGLTYTIQRGGQTHDIDLPP